MVREYVGSGRIAEIMAEFDKRRRDKRQVESEEWKQRVADDAAFEAEIEGLCRIADLLGRAVLVSCGYHNHRGEWRKRRGKEEKGQRQSKKTRCEMRSTSRRDFPS